MHGDRGRGTLIAFLIGAVLSAGNPIGVKFSNVELDPLWGAALRFSLAAALMVIVMAVLRLPFPRGRALVGAVLYGAVNFGLAFAFLFYALVEMGAGFLQILLAVIPLTTLLLAVAQRQERLRTSSVVGGGAGLCRGTAHVQDRPRRLDLAHLGARRDAAAVCLAEGALLVRIFPPDHPVSLNAVGMTVGAALLFLGSWLAGVSFTLPTLQATWLALAYMVVIGSGVVFILWVFVLKRWEASRAAYNFVLLSPITLVFSSWITGEQVGVELVFGGLLILAGVYIGALRPSGVSPMRRPDRKDRRGRPPAQELDATPLIRSRRFQSTRSPYSGCRRIQPSMKGHTGTTIPPFDLTSSSACRAKTEATPSPSCSGAISVWTKM